MPLYAYECEKCGDAKELLQPKPEAPVCCGEPMRYVFKPIAMVKMGNQTPSYRKKYLGTAPHTTRGNSKEEPRGGRGTDNPRGIVEGQKWLEQLA